MRIIDPGHCYELDTLDQVDGWPERFDRVRFVKRVGARYPGNEPPAHPGTTSQEVIRALIDRAKYVDKQEEHPENTSVIKALRSALYWLEYRAAKVRDELGEFLHAVDLAGAPHRWVPIELMPTCDRCGHIACGRGENHV